MAFAFELDELRRFNCLSQDYDHLDPITLDNEPHPVFHQRNWEKATRERVILRNEYYSIIRQLTGNDYVAARKLYDSMSDTELQDYVTKFKAKSDHNQVVRLVRGIPNEMYERMLPALRLATKLLDISLPWFYRLRHAESELVSPRQRKGAHKGYVLKTIPDPTDMQLQRFRDELKTLGDRLTFCITQTSSGYMEVNSSGDDRDKSKPFPFTIEVQLGFFTRFMDPDWDIIHPSELKAFYLHLAIGLVHELVHVVHAMKVDLNLLSGPQSEVYFDHENLEDQWKDEIGHAWSQYLFGGILRPIGHDNQLTSSQGLFWERRLHEHDPEELTLVRGRDGFALGMDSIAPFLSKEAWARVENKESTFSLSITPQRAKTEALIGETQVYRIWYERRLGRLNDILRP